MPTFYFKLHNSILKVLQTSAAVFIYFNPFLINVSTSNPLKHQKTYVFRVQKVGTLRSNGLIMITLIYTKQFIHLSGPGNDTSFFARDRLILVLGQKDDLTTR